MKTQVERSKTDKRRLRAAAEYKGVSVFADMGLGLRDLIHVVSVICAVLGALHAQKRSVTRRKYGRKS